MCWKEEHLTWFYFTMQEKTISYRKHGGSIAARVEVNASVVCSIGASDLSRVQGINVEEAIIRSHLIGVRESLTFLDQEASSTSLILDIVTAREVKFHSTLFLDRPWPVSPFSISPGPDPINIIGQAYHRSTNQASWSSLWGNNEGGRGEWRSHCLHDELARQNLSSIIYLR